MKVSMGNNSHTEHTAADVRTTLASKDANLDPVAQLAVTDANIRKEILAGIVSKDDAYRYNCFEVLFQISEEQPRVLYPEWDYFAKLLDSSNAFYRSMGLRLLASLTGADEEEQFEDIFERYFDLLDDEKVMVARYLVQSAGRIAERKPHLRERIAKKLLSLDQTHHIEGRKALIKADAIEFFDTFFEELADEEKVLAFAEGLLACSSPKARKAAKAFLNKRRV
jgi:hypothetical protein